MVPAQLQRGGRPGQGHARLAGSQLPSARVGPARSSAVWCRLKHVRFQCLCPCHWLTYGRDSVSQNWEGFVSV